MTNADIPGAIDAADQATMLAVLKEARERIEELQAQRGEKVAVIGLSGRFPGAEDIDAYWEMLLAGETGLRPVSDEELSAAGVAPEEAGRPDYVRVWGGFEDPAGFDAGFFGYSPRDAELLDPQQRAFLECAWSALEHAGYDSRACPGRIGVFAGGSLNYNFSNIQANAALRDGTDPIHAGLSNVIGMIPSRVAYHLDLKGPTVGVQATCATSLVCVHLAVQSLLAGDCDMAIAGAAAVGQAQPAGYVYKSEGVGSPDGQCHPFDASAQGTVFTNGVGGLVLKRLRDALEDGDTVYAVISGSAVGNDGSSKVGIAAPSVTGQAEVLEAALAAARLEPADIDYVETHGTGTTLGDPIEIASLNRVYGPALEAAGLTCLLGSAKGNVGHMDVAAGMGGLIKAILALRHHRLPVSGNFREPSPACNFDRTPFRVLGETLEWTATAGRPRRAAVSAFGMGGTNAHVILEEAPPAEAPAAETQDDPGESYLLPFSAQSPAALADMRNALAFALEADTSLPLADAAYSLQVGRRPMGRRFVALARSRQEAVDLLRSGEGRATAVGEPLPGEPGLVFLFPGQGTQHAGMAAALYGREAVFREVLDRCLALMPEGDGLKTLLLSAPDGEADELNRTELAQPALFAVEYALAEMWIAKGVKPHALLGHSIGEYVAACLAGVFSLEDAVTAVCARGRVMQACEPGAMLSVMFSENEARGVLSEEIELAAVNGPRSCVLSGTGDAIGRLAGQFERSGLGCRFLKTSHAFHSFMMEPALEEFSSIFERIRLAPPSLDIVSNVTGDWLTAEQATDPAYWVDHLRRSVLFGPGLSRLLALPNPLLLEVGPGSTLTRLARQQLPDNARAFASLPDANGETDAADHALLTFGALWTAGLDVDWEKLQSGTKRRRIGLPTYRFQRTSHLVPAASPAAASAEPAGRPENVADWFYQGEWTRRAGVPVEDAAGSGRRWLLLNGRETAEAIGEMPEGTDTVLVECGETFAFEEGAYRIDPTDPEHYRQLLADLAGRNALPDQIVNGFGIDRKAAPDIAFQSTLAIGRAIAAEEDCSVPLLTVLGQGMHQVTGSESLVPDAAMVVGLTRVLPSELPGLTCRSIDLPDRETDEAAGSVKGLADLLLAEAGNEITVCALRGGFVWAPGHASTPLTVPNQTDALQEKATYLVAGDLVEGLGLVYARALIAHLQARIILVGRPGLPPAQEWERWLASHSPRHPVSQFIHELRDIGVPGRDYVLFSGSLADTGWLKSVVADGQERFGPVQGVFHTAGMGELYHCPLAQATPDSFESLFATKVAGLRSLASALSDCAPDFVLVQSSLSTLAGGAGLAAYAAANSFVDAFVEARRGEKAPAWQAINWDTCLPYTRSGQTGDGLFSDAIKADEVWQVTRAVLARPGLSRVVVTPGDLAVRLTAADRPEASGEAAKDNGGVRPSAAGYVAPKDPIVKAVSAVMGELLGIERVGANDNFFELGGHSLLAIQVVTRLRKQFDADLPMRALLFEAPTAAGIAAVIWASLEAAERERETLASLLDEIETPEERREA